MVAKSTLSLSSRTQSEFWWALQLRLLWWTAIIFSLLPQKAKLLRIEETFGDHLCCEPGMNTSSPNQFSFRPVHDVWWCNLPVELFTEKYRVDGVPLDYASREERVNVAVKRLIKQLWHCQWPLSRKPNGTDGNAQSKQKRNVAVAAKMKGRWP